MKPDRRVLLWTAELLEQLSRDGTPCGDEGGTSGASLCRGLRMADCYERVPLANVAVPRPDGGSRSLRGRRLSGFRDLAAERLQRDRVGLGAAAMAGVQAVDRCHLVGG